MTGASFEASLLQLIRDMPDAQAEATLASALEGGQLSKADMGELAADLFGAGRYSMAMMLFARWTELEPLNPEPWSNLGLCLSRTGKLVDARTVLEHALDMAPGYAPALINLCPVYQYLGEHELQLEKAAEAVKLQSGSALAFNNLGTALLDLGRLSEAKVAFEASRSIEPGNFEAGFNLARVASDEGRHTEALAFLENALASRPGARVACAT